MRKFVATFCMSGHWIPIEATRKEEWSDTWTFSAFPLRCTEPGCGDRLNTDLAPFKLTAIPAEGIFAERKI